MVTIKDLGAVRTRKIEPRSVKRTPEPERSFLIESGTFTEESLTETENRVAAGELDRVEKATLQNELDASYTAVEAAQLLNTTPAVLKHSAEQGELYAFFADDELYIPKWQFLNNELVFLLQDLLSVIPEDWAPYRVRIFMENSETLNIPVSSFKLTGDYAALELDKVRVTVQLTPVEIVSNIGRLELVQDIIHRIQQYEMYR